MKANVGAIDKGVRIVVGIALLSLIFLLESKLRWFGLIGAVPIFTALASWCPLYTVLGIKTCPTRKK